MEDYHILRQDQNNDYIAMTWAPEGPPGDIQWRKKEKRRGGDHGPRQEQLLSTGRSGSALWRPYVPLRHEVDREEEEPF